jgi:hypothetical protein
VDQQPISEQEFTAIARRVAETAPPGLDEAGFNALIDAAVARHLAVPPYHRENVLRAQQDTHEKAEQLPSIGGLVGSFVPGPFRPVAAATGGGLGAMGRNLLQDRPLMDTVLQDATAQGLTSLGGDLLARGIRSLSPVISRLGDRLMKGALKADRGYLSKMTGHGRGNIPAREQELVETARQLNINPMSTKGADAIDDALERTREARLIKINRAPDQPVPGSGARAVRVGRRVTQRLGRGEAPQARVAESASTVNKIIESPRTGEVVQQRVSFAQQPSSILDPRGRPILRTVAVPGREVRAPKDLTPRQLAETVEETNAELRGLFGDAKLGPRAQTLMATQSARRGALDDAADTATESEMMRRLIDLRNVANVARHRSATHNPLSLTDLISLTAGRPVVAAGSAAIKPLFLGALGHHAQRLAPAMTRTGQPIGLTAEQLTRALQALLSSPSPTP